MRKEYDVFLTLVQDYLSRDPHLMRPVIDAATTGVKEFADKQRDDAGKLAFMLCAILTETRREHLQAAPFTASEIVERIAPWFAGTAGLKALRDKFATQP